MNVIAQLKLNPTPAQADALRRTLEAGNAACNAISRTAFQTQTFHRYQLQSLVYHTIKNDFGLSAQMVIRCLAKVADAYTRDTTTLHRFRRDGAIAFDDRILSWNRINETVSIWSVDGRLKGIPYQTGARQRTYLHDRQGETDLVMTGDAFYLLTVCDIPTPDLEAVEDVLGVDLGIVNLATDSDGEYYSGERVERTRQRYTKLRAALQRRGSKSAKRHLKKLRKRQARFQKDVNHCISTHIVAKAKDTRRAIALEDLNGIRTRTERTVRQTQRGRHSNWSFFQLRQFISYKAVLAGIPVVLVCAAYTSQRCAECGHTAKANRRTQAIFCCGACGHTGAADVNAARNISRAGVIPPIVSDAPRGGSARDKPHHFSGCGL